VTTNAYIFSWDQYGIEGIIPITEYEHFDQQNLINILSDKPRVRNPLNSIIQNLVLRARYNPQRYYEIYAVDCTEDFSIDFWREKWREHPQYTADLVRSRGIKLFSNRRSHDDFEKILIT
jgi:hypothetical protein